MKKRLIVGITGATGAVYGIELLNANDQLRMHDGEQLTLVNEASGRSSTMKLPV